MGCFSFLCKVSNEPILSTSFSGDAVHLFLLRDGKVIEHMHGNYDSYGRVFSDKKNSNSSCEWKMDWGNVCDLMFSSNKKDGIAAILSPYWKEGDPYPTEQSKGDPNQGWGKHGHLMSVTTQLEIDKKVEKPYHKTYYEE